MKENKHSVFEVRKLADKRNKHDRWFKELIIHFFEEFILAFYPDLYEEIDFSELTFLSEDLFTDIIRGEERRIDILVETKLKGEDVAIIVHTEAQAYYQKDFAERMFIYFSRLYEKHRKIIIPIAVFSYDDKKDEPNTFQLSIPSFQIIQFEFLKLELNKMNWRNYLKDENPVTAALLSKMNYTKTEQAELKREFLRILIKLESRYNKARMHLVAGFFDCYLPINYQEDVQPLEQEERVKVMELMSSWQRKGFEEGLERGIEKEKKEMIFRLLDQGCDMKTITIAAQLSEKEIKKILLEKK